MFFCEFSEAIGGAFKSSWNILNFRAVDGAMI